jgi:hypothetical protein
MDANNGYNLSPKYRHRKAIISLYRKLTHYRSNGLDVCVTVPSCIDGENLHPSFDVQQWKPYFNDRFIGINRNDISEEFTAMHPKCLFFQGDAFTHFAKWCKHLHGLYYLDSMQAIHTVMSNCNNMCNLGRFLANARPKTLLAVNMLVNVRRRGQLPNVPRGTLKRQVKEFYDMLPTQGWRIFPNAFNTYNSTGRTLMVTVFFWKP